MNIMKGKFFITAFYSDINSSLECFRPTEEFFNDVDSSVCWIRSHRKYFAPTVRFGICSVDNEF